MSGAKRCISVFLVLLLILSLVPAPAGMTATAFAEGQTESGGQSTAAGQTERENENGPAAAAPLRGPLRAPAAGERTLTVTKVWEDENNGSYRPGTIDVYVEKHWDAYLPEEYQGVEYIQSSGTQWIDTGVDPAGKELGMELVFQYMAITGWRPIAGEFYNPGDADRGVYFIAQDSNWFYIKISNYNGNSLLRLKENGVPFDTEKHILRLNITGEDSTFDGKRIGGSGHVIDRTGPNGSGNSIYLFRSAGHSYPPSSARIYRCKLYDGTSLIRDFVPCYRKSDGVIGLYDRVEGTFYTNQGSGNFTKGVDYEDPANPWHLVERTKIEDSQWTKTGNTWTYTGLFPGAYDTVSETPVKYYTAAIEKTSETSTGEAWTVTNTLDETRLPGIVYDMNYRHFGLDVPEGAEELIKTDDIGTVVLRTPSPNEIPEGMRFAGWYLNPDCRGTSVTQATALPDEESTTVYAMWGRDVTVKKIWNDNSNEAGRRQGEIYVYIDLLIPFSRDGSSAPESVYGIADNEWDKSDNNTWVFTRFLPAGMNCVIREDEVQFYSTTVETGPNGVTTITNTYDPHIHDLPIPKNVTYVIDNLTDYVIEVAGYPQKITADTPHDADFLEDDTKDYYIRWDGGGWQIFTKTQTSEKWETTTPQPKGGEPGHVYDKNTAGERVMDIDEDTTSEVIVTFKNAAMDQYGDRRDVKMTIDAFTFYNPAWVQGPNSLHKYKRFVLYVDGKNFNLRNWVYKADNSQGMNGGSGTFTDINLEIIGAAPDETFLFCIQDLDVERRIYENRPANNTTNFHKYGAEGIELREGFDIDTLTISDQTMLKTYEWDESAKKWVQRSKPTANQPSYFTWKTGGKQKDKSDDELWGDGTPYDDSNGYGHYIVGSGNEDRDTYLARFYVVGDATKSSFTWTSGVNCNTDLVLIQRTPVVTRDLTISKIVTGSMGDKTKEFAFTVTFTDADHAPVTGITGPGYVDWAESAGNPGTYTFKLSHGYSITIARLIVNTTYTVTENDPGGGYEVTVDGISGRSVSGTITTADRSHTFENHLDASGDDVIVPATGDSANIGLWTALTGGSFSGLMLLLALLLRDRRREKTSQ